MDDHQRASIGQAKARLMARHRANPASVPALNGRLARFDAVRRRQTGGWCILRTNARRTLALAASLSKAGLEAWTPQETRKRRLPRSRSFREYDEAIVPSFVFVRSYCLTDVLRAHADPLSPHPAFSVFQMAGRAPVIADRDLGDLRAREQQARADREAHLDRLRLEQERKHQAQRRAERRALRPDVMVGSQVELTEGAYAGLSGIVETVQGGEVVVRISPTFAPKVAAWLLLDAQLKEQTEPKSAAA